MPRFVRRSIRLAYRTAAVLLSLAILVVNLRLYAAANPSRPADVEAAVTPQLRFIGGALRRGAGDDAQALFPEGYFFGHAMYGLAWLELAEAQPKDLPLREHAAAEARWALGRVESPAGTGPFSPGLSPPYGVFYAGWSLRLRGGWLRLLPAEGRDPQELGRYEAQCRELAAALGNPDTPFPESYPGQAWPCDAVVAAAALATHDSFRPPAFASVLGVWNRAALQRLDPATGLLPHRVDPQTGRPLEAARGSSQSIIQRFSPEVDAAGSREPYARFRRQFVATPLGLPGVREYPRGVDGAGDVDSGPLLAGVSASATVVAYGAARVHRDDALAGPFSQVMEAAGMPVGLGETKRYAFGALPVGDAFVAWSKTAHPLAPAPPDETPLPAVVGWWWRWPSHGLSLLMIGFLWLPAMWGRRRGRTRRAGSSPDRPPEEPAPSPAAGPL